MLRIIGTIIHILSALGVAIIYGMIIYYWISDLTEERKDD